MKIVVRLLVPLLTFILVACQGAGSDGLGRKDPQPPEGVITGTLTNSDGSPAAGAQITLGSGGISLASQEATTATLAFANEAGEFAFDVDEAGEYTLTTLTDTEGAFARVTVTRTAEGELASTPVAMQAAELGGVQGRIDTNGSSAWAYLLGTSFLANSDDNGAFAISRVPAGHYLLAPGLLGVTGTSVPVTVQAGQVTTVTDPLRFGPVITGVEPNGFMALTQDPTTGIGEPSRMTIRGSGFGESIGVSQLRYAGLEISGHVRSWADNEIVIDTNFGLGGRVAPANDLRFTFASVAGETHSDPGGIVHGFVAAYSCGHDYGVGWISAFPNVFSTRVQGAELSLTAVNGVVRSAPAGQAVSTVSTDERGCAQAFIEPQIAGLLPVIAAVSFKNIEFDHLVTTNDVYLELSNREIYPGPNTLRGRLLQNDLLEPMTDDGNYTAIIHCTNQPGTRTSLELDTLGAFEVQLAVPEGGDCYQVDIAYQDFVLTHASLYTNKSGPDPVAAKPSAASVLALEDELSFMYMNVATDDLEWDIEIEYDTNDVQAVFDHYDASLWGQGFDQVEIEVDEDDEIEAEYTNTTTGVWVELVVKQENGRVNVDLDIEDPRSYADGSTIPAFSLTGFIDLEIPVYPGADVLDVEWDFNFDHPATGAQAAFDNYDQLLQDLGWTQAAINHDGWEANYSFAGVHLELEVQEDGGGSQVQLELNKLRFYTD